MENFLFPVLLLLLVGRSLGYIFERYGFQSLIGEVLAGIILGPIMVAIAAPYFIEESTELMVLSQFGVLMLMLLSGLMTDYRAFRKNYKASIFIGTMGVIVTFLIIFLPFYFIIGPIFKISLMANLFISAILSNTAIEIVAGVLIHSHRAKLKAVIIGASFVDDIIAVFLIGIVSTVVYSGEPPNVESMIILSAKVILFLGISLFAASILIERIYDKLVGRKGKITLTVTLIIAFLFAIVANLFGLHEVIGAYIAGLIIGKWGERIGPMLKRRITWEKLKTDIDTPLRAIFGPLFFGFIGISVVLPSGGDLPRVLPLILILIVLAVLGKIIGCGLGAKAFKFSKQESLALGCAMCGRGALELVLVSFGFRAGIIDEGIFTALVMVTVITVIITPILYTLAERKILS